MPKMLITRHAVERFLDRENRAMAPNAAYGILRRICLAAERLPKLTRTGQKQWQTANPPLVLITKDDPEYGLVCVTVWSTDPVNEVDEALRDEVLAAYLRTTVEPPAAAPEPPARVAKPTKTPPVVAAAPALPPEPCTCSKATRQREATEHQRLVTEAAKATKEAEKAASMARFAEASRDVVRAKTERAHIWANARADRDKAQLLDALRLTLRFLVERREDPEVAAVLAQIAETTPGLVTDKFLAKRTEAEPTNGVATSSPQEAR